MVIQDDYIDMDLTPAATPVPPPSSPRFEFQSAGAGGAGDTRHREAAFASPADELFYKGNLLPLHLPPRLQLVQRLLQDQEQQPPPLRGAKRDAESDAAATAERGEFDADAAAAAEGSKACAAKTKPSWAKKLKVVKRWASREYIRSLFLARPPLPSDIVGASASASGHGIGSVSARGSVLEQEEARQCHHRKSFSGIIRRVRLVATNNKAPGTSPLCSSSSSSSSSTPSCGNANGFFFRTPAPAPAAGTAPPALKRSSSARSSEEGAIQGAIAHCKRSQLLQPGMVVSSAAAARRSVSDVMFYSVTNTPRASSVAAGEVAQERRQEMCRG
jgi:hypothetical protein